MKETNQFQIFNHPQFGEMTTIQCNDGKVLFKANDVAKALGYSDYVKAVRTHCKGGSHFVHPLWKSVRYGSFTANEVYFGKWHLPIGDA